MLLKLKMIKQRQRDKSEQALVQAGAKLARLENALTEHSDAFNEYVAWRIEQENALYQHAHDTHLSQSGVDQFRAKIATLRAQDATLQKNIATCELDIEKAKAHQQACYAQLQRANKSVEKFDSLIALETSQRTQMAERDEENQLDEFVTLHFSGMKAS